MKVLVDFFPILLFFIAYKIYGIYTATAVAIIASVLQVGYFWFKNKKVENMHLITLAIIVVFGGATLILEDELFIKWKPTVVNWLFAAVFLGSQFIGKKNIVQRMMGAVITLPPVIWVKLNYAWVLFFIASGVANLYVMYNFDTDTWVNFKLFGMMGLTFAFIILQGIFLMRYIKPEQAKEGDS